jgi:spermidine synthase
MSIVLCLIFFISGASALIFEGLWLQLAGLTFGNSVWAASIVLSSFMGGLALGGGIIALKGYKVRNPIRLYAVVEIIIGVTGLLLVFFLPELTTLLAPLFKSTGQNPFLINFYRGIFSFLILIIPTTAMGTTLPILVKALYSQDANFGRALGRLYGWNTLGAMIGVMMSELFLIEQFGIKGAGIFAAILNLSAACFALRLTKTGDVKARSLVPHRHLFKGLSFQTWRLLIACSLSGFIMLALEVIWFRFMILFFVPNSWNFSIMLAVVLGGISIGGLVSSVLFKHKPEAYQFTPYLFVASGIIIIFLYSNFGWVITPIETIRSEIRISLASLFFLFPVSFVSGAVFTCLGKALHSALQSETQASGLLALFNTAGGTIGAFLAGFVMIPFIGIESSFLVLAIAYGFTGVLVLTLHSGKYSLKIRTVSAITFLLALVLFPFGFMEKWYLDLSLYPELREGREHRIAYKEGITETIQYLRQDLFGEPDFYRLVTNSYSMSGNNLSSRRYMKLFVYLPIALNENIKKALLVCYGVGSTAKALTDSKTIERIDIVDISKDVIEMCDIIYPDPKENPVNDQRVTVHIEDGRFYMQTTDIKYDLITAEPPPPKTNGIVNLYTQEYFQLIHNRLTRGGIVTYWLPVYQMKSSETKSILKAFHNVFPNCSLWTGGGFEWIMMGIKEPIKQTTEASLDRQWKDPVVYRELRTLGLGSSEQLGSLFIADGNRLENWIAGALPLKDNYPRRLSYHYGDWRDYLKGYHKFMDAAVSAENFSKSLIQTSLWPDKIRKRFQKHFSVRDVTNRMLLGSEMRDIHPLEALHLCLHNPLLQEYVLWVFNSDLQAQEIISNKYKNNKGELFQDAEIFYRHLAAKAAYQHNYKLAEKYLSHSYDSLSRTNSEKDYLNLVIFRMYFLYLQGQGKSAQKVAFDFIDAQKKGSDNRRKLIEPYQNWMISTLSQEVTTIVR